MNSEFEVGDSGADGFSRFNRDGFQIIKSQVSDVECDHLAAELTPLFAQEVSSARNRIGGLRNLLRTNTQVSTFAKSPPITKLMQQMAGCEAFPVRAIFFDKNPEANWLVPWHQDLAIAVAEQIETPGFTGWSMKDGIVHVHPPPEILEGMVTMRLHLDDCDANNGALKIISRSHCYGKLDASGISGWIATGESVICELSKGDLLVMRPLLLHASLPAENPKHRRILHIEYATQDLSNGLKWLDR